MRYYWLKLREDFFRDLRVKALRRYENGEMMVLLYLQLLLSALETGGVIPLMGVDEPAAEVALLLDVTEETAGALLTALFHFELLLRDEDAGLFLPAVEALTGSEGESADRMRKQRAKKELAAACEPHDFSAPSQCAHNVQKCDTEKEIEIEQETETEQEKDPTLPGTPSSEKTGSFFLPTKEKKAFCVGEETVNEYRSLWPELDIGAELLAMRRWLLANPGRQKTAADTPRFVHGWLSRSHEQARAAPEKQKETQRPPAQREPQRVADGYSGGGNRHTPSYDIKLAMEQMKTTVPKLRKKAGN